MTRIFTPKDTREYAETRIFGYNVSPDDADKIILYNSVKESELRAFLAEGFVPVEQPNPRETLYFRDRTISVPQYSAFGRQRRYESGIIAYARDCRPELEYEFRFRDNDALAAGNNYKKMASEFVSGLFALDAGTDSPGIFKNYSAGDIRHIIFGSLNAVAKQAEVLEKADDEYLDAQIVRIGKIIALNLGYVYSDQAGMLTDEILLQYYALARKNGERKKIKLYMFGRTGALGDGMKRQDIVFPNGIIDEEDIFKQGQWTHNFNNILSRISSPRISLNVAEPVEETYELLQKAKALGCVCIDMESKEVAESIERARRYYRGFIETELGIALYVSDVPLKGDTLAKELDSDYGEQNAVGFTVEHIRKN